MNKVLIADDSQSWLNHHEAVLRNLFGDNISITTALSASEANDELYLNISEPYNTILTDMQMESDFLPLYAGEWLIEQIQKLPAYKNTRVIIISATPSIRLIAEKYNVDYLPKYNCKDITKYKEIFNIT